MKQTIKNKIFELQNIYKYNKYDTDHKNYFEDNILNENNVNKYVNGLEVLLPTKESSYKLYKKPIASVWGEEKIRKEENKLVLKYTNLLIELYVFMDFRYRNIKNTISIGLGEHWDEFDGDQSKYTYWINEYETRLLNFKKFFGYVTTYIEEEIGEELPHNKEFIYEQKKEIKQKTIEEIEEDWLIAATNISQSEKALLSFNNIRKVKTIFNNIVMFVNNNINKATFMVPKFKNILEVLYSTSNEIKEEDYHQMIRKLNSIINDDLNFNINKSLYSNLRTGVIGVINSVNSNNKELNEFIIKNLNEIIDYLDKSIELINYN